MSAAPIRSMVERFMSMQSTPRIAILNDLLGEGAVSWADDTPARWPDLIAQVRERGLIDQLRERLAATKSAAEEVSSDAEPTS